MTMLAGNCNTKEDKTNQKEKVCKTEMKKEMQSSVTEDPIF